jgi:hypothetical protein
MLIQNYGLFWRREWIHFGAGSNAGHLKGVRARATTTDPVDFREQQGVYCLYDDNFRLVYVGQAGGGDNQRLFSRLRQHRGDSLAQRWTKLSWFGVRKVIGNGELKAEKATGKPSIADILNHVEAILIASSEPIHNRQGGRFGEDVEQYIQWRDDGNLGPEPEDMIREIWKNIKLKA